MDASRNNDALKILGGGQKRKWLPIRKTAPLLAGDLLAIQVYLYVKNRVTSFSHKKSSKGPNRLI